MESWYRRPVNTLIFNPCTSHGPTIYKINLIKTILNRLNYICSNQILFNRNLKQFKESFLWSGYSNYIIKNLFKITIKQISKKLTKFCFRCS